MRRSFSRAFLLAAGPGTRLRPITERLPKCLVPIHGRPLLSIWLEICEHVGIDAVLVNTHYRADQVRAWAREQRSRVGIELVHEDTLRGSAGTLAANKEFVRGVDDFFVFYADNLICADLGELKSFHTSHDGVLTLGLFHSSRPQDCGIVTLDPSGRITTFEEKPAHPRSNLANGGIYVARQKLFEFLPQTEFADFGKDVMPSLTGLMWGCLLDGYLRDVGTPESYQKALDEWPTVIAHKDESVAFRNRLNRNAGVETSRYRKTTPL